MTRYRGEMHDALAHRHDEDRSGAVFFAVWALAQAAFLTWLFGWGIRV